MNHNSNLSPTSLNDSLNAFQVSHLISRQRSFSFLPTSVSLPFCNSTDFQTVLLWNQVLLLLQHFVCSGFATSQWNYFAASPKIFEWIVDFCFECVKRFFQFFSAVFVCCFKYHSWKSRKFSSMDFTNCFNFSVGFLWVLKDFQKMFLWKSSTGYLLLL